MKERKPSKSEHICRVCSHLYFMLVYGVSVEGPRNVLVTPQSHIIDSILLASLHNYLWD